MQSIQRGAGRGAARTRRDPGRAVRVMAAVALPVALLLLPASSTSVARAEGDRDPGLLRIRVAKGDRWKFHVAEEYRVPEGTLTSNREYLLLGRDVTVEALEAREDGSADFRVTHTHIWGTAEDSRVKGGRWTFDSKDPERDQAKSDRTVQGYMNNHLRAIDCTVSPRGEVTALRPPPEGIPPHVLYVIDWDQAAVEPGVRADVQKLFALLPEKSIRRAKTWTLDVGHWEPCEGWQLGPLRLKCRSEGDAEETISVSLARDGAKRAWARAVREKPDKAGKDDSYYGPFDLELEGEQRIEAATGMLQGLRLKMSLTQRMRGDANYALGIPIDYSCHVDRVTAAPPPGSGK